MAFTADAVLSYYESQYGKKGGAEYFADFGLPDQGSWCCIGACDALKHAGRDIGAWVNCGTEADGGGIQAGFERAGFKKVSGLAEAVRGAFLIMDWHDENTYIYDHCCCWYGDYDAETDTIRTSNFNVGGTNGERWYGISNVREIWVPDYDDIMGWHKNNGRWQYLEFGKPITKRWKMGAGKYAGKWYWLNASGYVAKNAWIKSNGKTYYVGADGAALRNRIKYRQGKYYWIGDDGAVQTSGVAKVRFKIAADGSLSYDD